MVTADQGLGEGAPRKDHYPYADSDGTTTVISHSRRFRTPHTKDALSNNSSERRIPRFGLRGDRTIDSRSYTTRSTPESNSTNTTTTSLPPASEHEGVSANGSTTIPRIIRPAASSGSDLTTPLLKTSSGFFDYLLQDQSLRAPTLDLRMGASQDSSMYSDNDVNDYNKGFGEDTDNESAGSGMTNLNYPNSTGWKPFDPSFPKPVLKYGPIHARRCCEADAPKRKVHLVFHMREEPPLKGQTIFDHAGVDAVVIIKRVDRGLYFANNLHRNNHFEVTGDELKRKEKTLLRLPEVDVLKVDDDSSLQYDNKETGQRAFVSTDGTYDDEIRGLNMQAVFEEYILADAEKEKDPNRVFVAELNKRNNRGGSYGWAGDHSSKKSEQDGLAEPNLVGGTHFFTPLFVAASALFQKAWDDSGFSGSYLDGRYPDRPKDFSNTLSGNEILSNIFEALSPMFILHHGFMNRSGVERLGDHIDSGNCRLNPYLACFWDTFWCERLGMFVTGTVTAFWKHSIANTYTRSDQVGKAAQYIVEEYNKYQVDEIKEVTQETLRRRGPFPNHYDPIVNLSCVINNGSLLADILAVDGVDVPDTLLVETCFPGIVYTNNIERFNLFYTQLLGAWNRGGMIPIREDTCLTNVFLLWLRDTYDSFDGNRTKDGRRMGGIRYQTSMGFPLLQYTVDMNNRSALSYVRGLRKSLSSKRLYIQQLKKFATTVTGADVLKLQKFTYAYTGLKRNVDPNLTSYNICLPGSTKHQERLRNKGFDIKNAQMEQVVNSVSIKLNVCKLKGEEVCCKTLKTVDKGEDFLSPGSPVFATKISESGHPELYRHRLGVQEEVFAGIKHFGSDRNLARDVYAPYWANPDWICNSLDAYLPSSKNMEFNLKVKKNGKERALLTKEEVHSLDPDMMVHKSVQSLLVKNRYLVLEEPPLFASNYLDVDHSKFLEAVTYSGDASSGYIADLDLERLKIKNHCLPSLSTIDWKYHPSFKIQKADETSESKRDALFNLCLHVLANSRWSNGNLNFYVKYLVNTKELLVLVPSLTQASTVKVVSVVYREKKRDHWRVYNRWFWETPTTVVASHPTMIGKDTIHLCDGGLQS
jgi:hypothetical protein